MGSKLEECARVLCKAAGRNPDYVWTDGKPQWTMYVDNARAVIRCLMEPDETMLKEFRLWDAVSGPSYGSDDYAVESLRAMLQSVLDEGK